MREISLVNLLANALLSFRSFLFIYFFFLCQFNSITIRWITVTRLRDCWISGESFFCLYKTTPSSRIIPLRSDCRLTSAIILPRDSTDLCLSDPARPEKLKRHRLANPAVMILKSRLIAIKILVCDLCNAPCTVLLRTTHKRA